MSTTVLIAITVLLAVVAFIISLRAYRNDRASLGNLAGAISLIITTIGTLVSINSHEKSIAPEQQIAAPPPPIETDKPVVKQAMSVVRQKQSTPSVPTNNTEVVVQSEEEQIRMEPMSEPNDLTPDHAYRQGMLSARTGNHQQAVRYYRSAADRGIAAASYELALLYQTGSGVAKNESAAFRYMEMAAMANYIKAFRPLGEMYHGGRGVLKDRDIAADWYKKAADAGDEIARRILYNM